MSHKKEAWLEWVKCWVIVHSVYICFFGNISIFKKKSLRKSLKVSDSWDPDQAKRFVKEFGPKSGSTYRWFWYGSKLLRLCQQTTLACRKFNGQDGLLGDWTLWCHSWGEIWGYIKGCWAHLCQRAGLLAAGKDDVSFFFSSTFCLLMLSADNLCK